MSLHNQQNDEISKALEMLNIGKSTNVGFREQPIIDFSGKARNIKVKDNQNDLEKSHLLDTLSNSENIDISKTGEELKEKLVFSQLKEENELIDIYKKINEFRDKISVAPEEEVESWRFRSTPDISTQIPKIYCWRMMNGSDSKIEEGYNNLGVSQNQSKLTSEEVKAMRDYNDAVYKYVDCSIELSLIKTFINNIEPKRIYKLSIKQAASLGF